MKYQLPNGCYHSQLSVHPKNWKTKAAKIMDDWFISYRFYDPNQTKPKQVVIKRMNQFKSLSERQLKTQELLENEINKLRTGFNPFLKHSFELMNKEEEMSLIEAINFGYTNASVSEVTKKDLHYALKSFQKAAILLGIKDLKVSFLSRKHYKHLLEKSSNSNDRFNKNRSYLMIILAVLCELEIINSNPARDIKKKKTVKVIRQTLSPDERIKVNDYLKLNYPSFHRFLHIFYHSGTRISEIVRVKAKDVDLKNQRFKVVVRKGKNYTEVWKLIKDVALPYWNSVMGEAISSNHYVFSEGLSPGGNEIKPYQIGKRWYRLVKKKLGIEADFYSLKHLHTTEIVELLNDKEAAKHNSHTSTAMVNNVYDVNREKRTNSTLKGLDNSFA